MAKKHKFSGEVLPERAFVAVGDIHGRADLLDRMIDQVQSGDLADVPVIFVGDYVDRGEDSRAVLEKIMRFQSERAENSVICLLGNHEQMMLSFLEEPAQHGPRWLRYGGLQTVASFGVQAVAQTAPEEAWVEMRDALSDAMGKDLIRWLYSLPTWWKSGNVAVVHAGADPRRDITEQDDQVLIWGLKRFDEEDRTDGVWVVHGHTIVDNAIAEDGRISVDTGAYATSVLSAAVIRPNNVSFLIA